MFPKKTSGTSKGTVQTHSLPPIKVVFTFVSHNNNKRGKKTHVNQGRPWENIKNQF